MPFRKGKLPQLPQMATGVEGIRLTWLEVGSKVQDKLKEACGEHALDDAFIIDLHRERFGLILPVLGIVLGRGAYLHGQHRVPASANLRQSPQDHHEISLHVSKGSLGRNRFVRSRRLFPRRSYSWCMRRSRGFRRLHFDYRLF